MAATLPAAKPPEPAVWPPGERYQQLELLGEGASKRVYRACDKVLDREVAISIIRGADPRGGQRTRLLREVRTTARLGDHPHILTVHDVGDDGRMVWIVSQHVRGGSVADLLARHRDGLPVPDAMRIARDVADALDFAHAHGVVHRDVKPENVLLDGERAVLADFGVALLVGGARVTAEGGVVGTPTYMAPEQARGEPSDARADLYALGAMLFELLTGRPPFVGSAIAVIAQHSSSPPPELTEPEVPEALARLVAELLGKRACDRPESAADVRRRLEALTGGPAIAEPAPAPARDPIRIVGREPERDQLHDLLARAVAGRPGCALLVGEGGIGKSQLARDLARDATLTGVRVLWGECVALSGGDLPYAPIAAALRGIPASELAAAAAGLPERGRRELAHAFPDLSFGVAATDDAPGEADQSALFGGLHFVLRELAAERPGLLVIEDFHWADPSSRDFLTFLVRGLRSERLGIVVTVREDDADRAMRRLLVELAGRERVMRLDLGLLDRSQVAEHVAGLLGQAPAQALVDELFARGEGNPFYTEALVAAGPGDVPPRLRDVLLLPIEALSAEARDVVRAVAVIGRPVEPELVLDWPGVASGVLVRALREAIEQRVLLSDPETERFDFRHALVREAVYEDLHAVERRTLHAAAAAAMQAGAEAPNPAELARHWTASHQWLPALRASYEAGLGSSGAFAYADALEHFERALELWDKCSPAPGECDFDRVDILSQAAAAAHWTGYFKRARKLARAALDLIDETAEPKRAATLYERLGRCGAWQIAESRAGYARALELLAPSETAERLRLLVGDALALSWDARWAEAQERAEAALEAARHVGSAALEGSALAVRGIAQGFQGDSAEGERELRRALAIVDESGAVAAAATIRLQLADVLRVQGRREPALTTMERGAAAASAKGADGYASFMAVNAADDLFVLGRWPEAAEKLDAVAETHLSHPGRIAVALVRGRLAAATGRHDEAAETLGHATELAAEDTPPPEILVALNEALAELELGRGRPAQAVATVLRTLEQVGDRDEVLYLPELLGIGCRACADWARSAGGDPELGAAAARAEALVARLRRLAALAREPGTSLPLVDGHLLLAEAEGARLRGESPAEAWSAAARHWRALGHLPLVTYARMREGEAGLATPRGRPAAAEALELARSGAVRMGAEPLVRRVEALARGAGIDASPRDAAGGMTAGSLPQL